MSAELLKPTLALVILYCYLSSCLQSVGICDVLSNEGGSCLQLAVIRPSEDTRKVLYFARYHVFLPREHMPVRSWES